MTNHLEYPANLHSPIADPLRCIRLRFNVPRWVSGRWVQVSVKQRADDQAYTIARSKPRAHHPKRWHPDEGRESPREEWMSWRHSSVRYAYPGWMRFYHGAAPALVGRATLYGPCPGPRAAYRRKSDR